MVCRWTGQYLYQPDDNEGKTIPDIVCDAIIAYVETYGSKHNLEIVTAVDKDSWSRHGKPIEVTTYSLKHGTEITPIEEVSEMMLYGGRRFRLRQERLLYRRTLESGRP